jgi:PPIC-type PPIASE domain
MSQFIDRQCVSKRQWALLGALTAALSVAPALAQSPSQSPAGTAPPAAGQSAKPGAPPAAAPAAPLLPQVPPDTVVMKVGNQQITADQFQGIVKTLNPNALRSLSAQNVKVLGENYATFLALAQKAAAEGLDQTPEFKQRMELARKQALVTDEYRKLNESVEVKPDDVSKYYSEHQKDFEQVQIRQVSVRKKPAGAKGDAAGLPDDEAKKRADDIRQALVSGQDATKVSEQYKLANVVFFDPTPRSVRHGQLPADTDRQAWTLQDGGVSDVQNNPMNYYFIQVVKHETQPVSELTKEIEGKLREEKFKAALDNIKGAANIWLDPKYFPTPAPGAASAANAAAPASSAQPAPNPAQKPN